MPMNVFGPSQGDMSNPYQQTGYIPSDGDREALRFMTAEKTMWNEEEVFLTTDVSYLMRNVTLRSRKNYFGIFDSPYDEATGEKKTWIPLTEWTVESVVKSVDLDMKDILIRPGNPQAVGITPIIRALVFNVLKDINFGQILNDVIRVMARDGTAVIKTWDEYDKKAKRRVIKSRIVDLFNIWIDPSANDIQSSASIIERSYMSQSEIEKYKDVWKDLGHVVYSRNIPRIYQDWGGWSFGRGEVPYTEIYERWGQIRKSWVTGDEADFDVWVEGQIVASGIGGPIVIHYVGINKHPDGIRPYEEVWYKHLDGRWFGRGISEMLFSLQEDYNRIINTRKMNSMILQNGLFLIRKGSGVTPEVINALNAGGGIPVMDINKDIKQLQVQDYRQSSYSDEDRISLYSDRVSGAFDINRGEAGKASASATATLTQDRHIRDTFVLIQEGIGFFIERLILRQYIPLIKKIMKPDDIIRISGDTEALDKLDEAIIQNRLNKYIANYENKNGFRPEPDEEENFKIAQVGELGKLGPHRFAKYFRTLFDEEIDVEVSVTDEKFNRVVAVQQLRDMIVGFANLPVATKLNIDAIMSEMLNLMGIRGEFFLEKPQVPTLAPGAERQGRLLKNPPELPPSELTATLNSQGAPLIGQGVPQTNELPRAAVEGLRTS